MELKFLSFFFKSHNLCAHPSIELFKDGKIYFIEPLAKQDQFYVFKEDDDDGSSEDGSDDSSSSLTDQSGIIDKNTLEISGQSSHSSFEELRADEDLTIDG